MLQSAFNGGKCNYVTISYFFKPVDLVYSINELVVKNKS